MTENEAIGQLQIIRPYVEIVPQRAEALDMAIKALEEIQQYRAIGTVEECREAAEKQKPKSPDYEGDGYADGQLVYDTWICPCCGKRYEVDYDNYDYCPNCGQHIDTSVEVDDKACKTIEKKILPEYYNAVISGDKKFELRKDEDNIQAGDFIVLKEWDGKRYTGRQTLRRAKYVLRDVPEYGLCPGYCIIGW